MKRFVQRALVSTVAAGAALVPASAASAQPVITGGLVNVTIVDFADVNVEDVVVQLPVSVAANVCDVDVAVLLAAIEDTGSAECDATATSRARA
jgi:hypothetical protein